MSEIEGPGGQTGSEGSRKRERRSKGQCIRTLSVVVVQPASSDAGGVHDPTSEFFILYFRVYLHDK